VHFDFAAAFGGPRMLRIRDDKPLHEADTLQTLEALLGAAR
jgi:DNA ligase 1